MALTKVSTHVIGDNLSLGGNPTTSTQSASDNSTKIATTAYVTTAVANLVDGAPSTLNTLNEIAAALNDDAALNTTLTNSIATKLPLAGGTITGNLKVDASFTVNGNVDTSASLGEVLQLSQTDSVGGFLWSVNRADGAYKNMSYHAANQKFYRDSSNITMTLASSGKVGIGTTAPTTALHVSSGDGNAELILQRTGAQASLWGLKPYNADFFIRENGTDRVTIKAGGNVGIGITNPAEALDVSGWLQTTSGVKVATHPVISYAAFDSGYATRLGSTGSSTLNATQIYAGGSVQATFKGGNLGIGEISPLGKLHVKEGDSGQGSVNSNFDQLVIEDDAHSGISILSGTSSDGAIYFGDSGANNRGQFKYRHASDSFGFITADGGGYALVLNSDDSATFGGRVELANGKPIFSETDNGTHQYSHLCTGSFYSGSNSGVAINTNIPSHNVSGNNMFMITIKGFAYDSAGGGIIDCNIGMYSGENGFHNASYSGSNIPKEWLGKIRVGYTSANKVIILLGDIDTGTNYEMAVSCGVQGFYGVDPDYFTGWTTSAFTSLSGYTGVTNIPPKQTTMIGFEAYTNSMSKAAGWHTISNSMSTEAYDHGGFYDTSTGKFQPTIAGMYMFSCGGYSSYNSGTTGQERYAFSLSKNGSLNRIAGGNYSDGDTPLVGMSYVEYLNGGSDYVVLSMYSAVAVTLGHPSHPIWWQAHLINAGPGGSATSWTI